MTRSLRNLTRWSTPPRQALAWWAVVLTLSVVATGCQNYEGPQRAEVFGSVTWKDQPVDGGVINFMPTDGTSRNASADITAGKYKVPEEIGPNLGAYKVMVNWATKTDSNNPDSPMQEQIPREYNLDTKLTATVDKSPQELNFAIPN